MNTYDFVMKWLAFYVDKGWARKDAIVELMRRALMTSPDGEFNEVIISTHTANDVLSVLADRMRDACGTPCTYCLGVDCNGDSSCVVEPWEIWTEEDEALSIMEARIDRVMNTHC